MRYFLLLLLGFLTLSAGQDMELKKLIGRMIVVGFPSQTIDKNSQIVKEMQEYDLGGVILFDKFYKDRNLTKNISSPIQLKKLTSQLKKFSTKPLLISIDQEGGRVARLKPSYGFLKVPSAKEISQMSVEDAKRIYDAQSQMLHINGINTNFAPVVDLAINPKNKVIYGLNRSFGATSDEVVKYAKILIDSQTKQNVISVLKHFPGHGSSLGDSHKGFVDITKTWSPKEISPYYRLIKAGKVDMLMTAHVFNAKLDKNYPATLSRFVNTKLLREQLGFNGVVISDDMQMKAISKHYSLKDSVTLAINSGVDIVLFGNQLGSQSVKELVEIIYAQVQNGTIKKERILEANQRIQNLHFKNLIIQRPIDFAENRIDMTKAYIKQHYGFEVKNIEIEPKIIVLHWTAVMDFEKCFLRLKGEMLYSDRADIASAGALNVSAHFLVARDGTITQLMPDNWMARHVIGLNYSTIGIENIGGENNAKEDLTQAQVESNVGLVKYLKAKYPSIEYLIGHHEYRAMEKTPLWLELDDGYRTKKADPGDKFMKSVRGQVEYLELKKP
ncbi:MAG: glycoside hydrolase family 3 N-terminal domain-containing protein [Campylobacterota bacterium]|nr:glycoside hydrolase family 3 N-terminal domain-containing protein [Campylobacterota bacterium]